LANVTAHTKFTMTVQMHLSIPVLGFKPNINQQGVPKTQLFMTIPPLPREVVT